MAHPRFNELRRAIARALDVVPERVRQLGKMGMPTTSVEAALAWREQHFQRPRRRRSEPDVCGLA